MPQVPPFVAEAQAMYRDGAPMPVIAERFGRDPSSLYRAMKRAGTVFNLVFKNLTQSQRQEAVRRYLNGESQTRIAMTLGVDRACIRKTLLKSGTRIRPQGDDCRTLPLNESAFDVVTDEAAYWIGFLMADGNIRLRNGRAWAITLTLSAKDSSHVAAFRTFLKSGHKIRYGKPYLTKRSGVQRPCTLSVSSFRLAERLGEFGVVPCKTHVAKVIGLEDNRHFWRGVIDGDGTVRVSKNGRPEIYAFGARGLIEQFRAFCVQFVSTNASVRSGIGIWKFSQANDAAATIIRELYRDASVSLGRKHATANRVIARWAS